MEDNRNAIKYLNKINSPEDLKAIPRENIGELADEIREELVRVVSKNGGHLASNLGVVELTMAIHRVFDSPKDHIIFDVGHQSYVHKLLTGRYSEIDTLRKAGGLCGFTKRDESVHDCFGAGHSSTSLSAGLGFAISDKLNGSDAYTVVVVGDGAYTGGMIHEALNNCRKHLNLIIILNENEMSISKNIGRFATALSKLRARPGYFKTKRKTGAFLKKLPLVGTFFYNVLSKIKKFLKNALYGSNYFESVGIKYLGPIDGNDYDQVEKLLKQAKSLNESVVVHLKTVKGKGYPPAESAPDYYHGMAPCDTLSDTPTFSATMGRVLSDIADEDPRVCAITAAMCDGTGLAEFRDRHPLRFFDVGIAEEHALTFAAGLAANGMKPVVAIYSTFLQRGFDNIIHDIALQKLPVVMCVDRTGLNSADGATHHGIFDVAFISEIPDVKIYTPITLDMLEVCMHDALAQNVPCVIRYPSGHESEEIVSRFYYNSPQVPDLRCDFSAEDNIDVIIITHGRIASEAIKASDALKSSGTKVGIVLLEMIRPYEVIADRIAAVIPNDPRAVIFLEEEIYSGGMGVNIRDILCEKNIIDAKTSKVMALRNTFADKRAMSESIYKSVGIDADSIIKTIEDML